MHSPKQRLLKNFTFLNFLYLARWGFISSIIGIMAGTASAWFLLSLDWVTNTREANLWLVYLLPVGGLVIGLLYHYYGESVVKGNNQLIEEFHSPKKIIPLRMAPFVLFGTLATHLFGGSAGREGTAIQLGGALADQITKYFKLRPRDRRIILTAGVSAGFASVFGTPLAGAVFALEVFTTGRMRYDTILPSFIAAIVGDYICHLWQVSHIQYAIPFVPEMSPLNLIYISLAGIAFGLAAWLFSKTTHFWHNVFSRIKYPPLRPVIGGAVIALSFYLIGTSKYLGLGVPVIESAFEQDLPWYDFLVKTLYTGFTLGAGFKGGEVTPLFFVGSTLGNFLSGAIPLPVALLAGAGFVAVFSGATNTPIACTLMGIELFGAECAVYIGIACVLGYLFSGHSSIYQSQIVGSPKHLLFGRYSGKTIKSAGTKPFRKNDKSEN